MWKKDCFPNMRQPSDCGGFLLENIQIIEKLAAKDRRGGGGLQVLSQLVLPNDL